MSLYNNIADSLSSQGVTGSIRSGLDSALGGVDGAVSKALGGGMSATAVGDIGESMASNAAMNLVNKYVPLKVQYALDAGSVAAADLMRGDWDAAGVHLLDSGLLNDWLPGLSGIASQKRYWGTPTPLFGGISPKEAKRTYEEMRGQRLAKKNLWLIEVSSKLKGKGSSELTRFNLFATEVEYEPMSIAGEKRRVGGAVVDAVQGCEPTELRLTTLDDQVGSLKRWFAAHHGAAVHRDGTVGVPGKYAITIKIVHSFISRDSNRGGYEDIGLYRPVSMGVNLSRREDGLQEVQMVFSQLDTFMKP